MHLDLNAWLPPKPAELQSQLPQYDILTLLGRGGMGAVYQGRQPVLDRMVAIKILPPGLDQIDASFSERFRREAVAMAKLNHPGLVAVYDFGQMSDGMLYLVMEHVDGTDVAHMLAQMGRLPPEQAMAITAHVCDAMKYAHERKVVHRDIKPANIMVGYNGVVKVADFGLAKMNQGGESTGMPHSGMAMGTMHYMAPEALTLGASVDHRADIYAMGVMLYHMLTGRLPQGVFKPASSVVPGLDPRYDTIISQAMKEDREQRYQQVAELRRDLDALRTKPVPPAQAGNSSHYPPAAPSTPAHSQIPPGPPARPRTTPIPHPRPVVVANFNAGFWLPVLGMAGLLVAAYVWLAHPVRKNILRLEGEKLKVTSLSGGRADTQGTAGFKSGLWSNDSHLWWHDAQMGDTMKLTLPVKEPGMQRIRAVLSGAGDYAVVAVSVDGTEVPGSPFDLQSEFITPTDILDWGERDLKMGDHTVEVKLAGYHGSVRNDRPSPYGFGLDYIQLEPPEMPQTTASPGSDAAHLARPSASACTGGDSVRHLNSGDEIEDRKSADQSKPRHTWVPHRGGMEWVQYEWETPQVLGESQVFWFDDSSVRGGVCKLPAFWRVLYREESGAWVPVDAEIPAPVADAWNGVKFPAVRTTGLRISVQCQPGWSSGICRWKAIAADPATVLPAAQRPHPDLLLGDLTPLRKQVGWDIYYANVLSTLNKQEGSYMMLKGKPCTQYIWAHADSRLEFSIPVGYTHFSATGIGPHNDRPNMNRVGHGGWSYSIEVDGVPLFTSNELRTYPNRELPMEVSFPAGSKRLTLLVDKCGDANSDHAYWANPTLSTAAGTHSRPGSSAQPVASAPSNPAPSLPDTSKAAPPLPPGYVRVNTQSLFNGRNLMGWRGQSQYWSVEDGAITMKTTSESHPKEFTSLVWKDEVSDFELTCQFRITGGDSKAWRVSGIQFRTRMQNPTAYSLAGYNADLDHDWRYTGNLVEKLGRNFMFARGTRVHLTDNSADPNKPLVEVLDTFGTVEEVGRRIRRDGWSTCRIVAAGNRIQLHVNDLLTADVTDDTTKAARKGLLGLSNFYSSVMTAQFKDLQLSELCHTSGGQVLAFGGHRYQFVPGKISWHAARNKAEEMGGHLATLATKLENDWAARTFYRYLPATNANILLGAYRQDDEWRWITGEPFAQTFWHSGEPNAGGKSAVLHLWRAADSTDAAAWDDTAMELDPAMVGYLVEWDDDGSPEGRSKRKIRVFAEKVDAVLRDILSPLEEEPDHRLRSSLQAMRDDLVAEGRSLPPASLDAYRAAHALCMAMIAALDERSAASSATAWSTRTQALRPVMEDLHTRTRELLPTVP